MGKKINELESTNVINNDDIFVISQSPAFEDSKQITKGDVFANTEAEIKNSLGTNEYDNTVTYNIGDYCIYENILYKCITEISVPEEFNSNHWTETKLLNVLDTLNNQLNLRKNIITAGLTSNYVIQTSGDQILSINSIFTQVGDKFSLNNGGVIIGEGIHHVLVNAHFHMNVSSTGGSKNFYITLNNSEIAYDINSGITANTNVSRAIPSKLISVNQGDYIKLGVYGSSGDSINSSNQRTYITVQVID